MNDVTRMFVGTTVGATAKMLSAAFTVFDRVQGATRYLIFGAPATPKRSSNQARDFANHPSQYARRAENAVESFEDNVSDTISAKASAAKAYAEEKLDLDDPDRRPYEERTKDELCELARKVGIEGRSKMTKGELIGALRSK